VKKRSKVSVVLNILFILILIMLFPKIAYSIDSKLVSKDKRPIFVVPIDMYKDGGTTVYQGIKYQVIKWNKQTTLVQADGKTISGIKRGYEISKYPNYKDINEGPGKELEFISNK
jgi:hypothetical protein